jgi:hypothetical protein
MFHLKIVQFFLIFLDKEVFIGCCHSISFNLFISFAPPKEPSRIRSTDYKFAPFPVCPRTLNYRNSQNSFCFWILKGLREFWEKATVLKLVAMDLSKQYCLRRNEVTTSCIAWAS